MTQWIISSSLLILAVICIRTIGGDRLSARLRYALWGLVLLRLLIPVSIGESSLSLQNWMPEDPQEITSALTAVRIPTQTGDTFVIPAEAYNEIISNEQTANHTVQSADTAEPTAPVVEDTTHAPTVQRETNTVNIPLLVWVAGMVSVGLVFLMTNVHFALRLRRSRRHVMTETVPVYVTEAVETPCLFGLVHPAVYITPDVWADTMALRHVLAHELTHYRHGDHLWSLLRCVAVTVHWYNPLVWAAVVLSQKDGELACDEGALHRLGGRERTAYARTLMALTCGSPRGMLTAATSMTGSESDLKMRVLRIVKNPKMPKIAIPVVLAAALILGVVLFTGESRLLEGAWYAAREEDYGTHYGTKALVTTRLDCRDDQLRITQYENDVFYWSAIYTYEVKDDVLYLERTDGAYEESYPFTWVGENGIDLGDTNSSLWEGLFTKGDPEEMILTDDPMMEVTAFTDLTREGGWEPASNLGWVEGAFVDMLLRAEISAERPMPTELTYTDYCYGITAVEHGKTVELVFCDGWLYRDGVGYRLENTDVALTRIQEDIIWQPADGYTDELGNAYSLGINSYSEPYLQMLTEHGYWMNRYYPLEDPERWQRAWEEAEANCVEGEHQGEKIVMYLHGVGDAFPNVWADGTITGYRWEKREDGSSEGIEYYIRPEDMPQMMERLKPYLEMAAYSAELGAEQRNTNGSWTLESSPVAAVTQLELHNAVYHRESATQKTSKAYATVNGGIVEAEFDSYVLDNVFHIRWADGSEEAVPCELDGDTLTLYAEEGTWVLRRGELAPIDSADVDVIRIGRNPSSTIRLDTSAEKLAELEALLRAGMVPAESGIIYSERYFYKFIGLEEAFGAPDVTLSDLGTLHFNGESYMLTNWDEVEAFLETLYRKM